jgi:hypothetical protein
MMHVKTVGLLLVLAGTVAHLAAKGATVRLTIEGPGLPSAVAVTDATALAGDVFPGNFIGAPAEVPDARLPRYLVSFYVATPRQPIRLMYVVHYVHDPRTRRGFVYLPRQGEPWYRLNASTILRGQEGEWHFADRTWSNALARSLRGPK